jgi:glycosyltransferase involved in cell wall biosynthesis
MKPLRILVAHNVSRLPNGGMSRLMTFIHERLVNTGDYVVDFFCEEDVPERWRGRMSRFGFPFLVYRKARAAAARGAPYNIINIHEPSSALVSVFKSHVGRPSVVVTSHGVESRAWDLACEEGRLGRGGPSLKTRLVHPLLTLTQANIGLRHADHIFCLNEEDRDYLSTEKSLDRLRITRIFPAADKLFFEVSRERDYARCEHLLFAGTWRKNKGIEDLIPAFTALCARHEDLRLTVLGGGLDEATIRKSFPKDIRKRISCIQTTSDTETAAWFAHADILVLPSLFEGTPLTLVEAMMSGLPVVTTDTCGMKDVIDNDRNGLLVPMRSSDAIQDAVERLIREAGLRARLGTEARRDALENYTWDAVAAPIGNAYQRLCYGAANGRQK